VIYRSRLFANLWRSALAKGFDLPVCSPDERIVSMKSLRVNFCFIVSSVKFSPRGFRTETPFTIKSAARGISEVITRSLGLARLEISLSATSKPGGTCTKLICFILGRGIGEFATKFIRIFVLMLARQSISLTALGHASASTQIVIKRVL